MYSGLLFGVLVYSILIIVAIIAAVMKTMDIIMVVMTIVTVGTVTVCGEGLICIVSLASRWKPNSRRNKMA